MNENRVLPMPAGAEEMRRATEGIEPVDSVHTGLKGALLLILGTALFLGISALVTINDESTISIAASYIGIVLFLGSFLFLFRQYMVKQVDGYFNLARAFVDPLLAEGERFLAVTWFRRLGLTFSYDLGGEQGLFVFTTHRLFMLKMKGAYKETLESSPQSVQVSVCDLGISSRFKWGGFISLPPQALFLKKLFIIPEGTDDKHHLGYFKVGPNGRTIRSIFCILYRHDRALSKKLSRKRAVVLIIVGVVVTIIGVLLANRIITDARQKESYMQRMNEDMQKKNEELLMETYE